MHFRSPRWKSRTWSHISSSLFIYCPDFLFNIRASSPGLGYILIYRVRTKLESPWMSLNLKTKIQGLECPWICKEVLECPWILLALVFGYFLKLFDIQDGHFVELILHIHIWPHYKVTFWTIQRQILLISNAFSSVFSPWICWYMALDVLEKSLNLTLPDMYEPWIYVGRSYI
jgi:hypothetical protein